MFEFMNDPEALRFLTIALYTLIALVSLIISTILLTFKGKNLMDWSLALKNLAMSFVMFRILLTQITAFEGSPELRFWTWAFVAIAYSLTLLALAREHVFYKNRNIIKTVKKRQEMEQD